MTAHRDLVTDLLALARGDEPGDEVLDAALALEIPSGRARGLRLGDLPDDAAAAEWFAWATTRPAGHWPPAFAEALWLVAAAFYPHLAGERREAA